MLGDSMLRLNQVIATEKTIKSEAFAVVTSAHKELQKTAPLAGISRSYIPRDDEGERLPPESTRVQVRAQQLMDNAIKALTILFDITATKDWGNTQAKASIMIDGQVLLADVPAPYLLFLEKQLIDIHTFVAKLPVLDPSETWTYDAAADAYATPAMQTVRTKKVPRNHVKAEATKEHPAQVDVYYEDVPQGTWSTVKYSGALPQQRVNELLARVQKLQQAVKYAREEANCLKVEEKSMGATIFNYLFS